jgi:DNA-binding SARP family transcriptional activator
MLRLTTLGGLSVHSGEAKTPVVSRPRHLALLCLLAASASRGVSRDRILALLWPELDTEHGRNALNQLLFGLRRDLGDVVVGRAELRLNAAALPTDLEEFEAAIHRGDLGLAAELYRGPLADGFHISGARRFLNGGSTRNVRDWHADRLACWNKSPRTWKSRAIGMKPPSIVGASRRLIR